jgi:dTDP-4-dehydrorhamnose 3,5-epimerase
MPVHVLESAIAGLVVFEPTPFRDDRGFFVRTFDAAIADGHGVRGADFLQDSQSRSRRGTVRGLHTRLGGGEGKLVRCARGAAHFVVVDARPGSATFGTRESFILDDQTFRHLYLPRGMLNGFQALTDYTDICYRIDREHDPAEDAAVRYDDPELAVDWPLAVTAMSDRDRAAGSWAELCRRLRAEPAPDRTGGAAR